MSASPSPRQIPPAIRGRYSIHRKLGSGSLGTVYLARDDLAGRPVALKLLHTQSPVEAHASVLGGDRELSDVEDTLRRAASGKPALLCIAGRTGLGKTRLLEEARLRAQLRGLHTVEVRCFPGTGAEPELWRALRALRVGGNEASRWLDAMSPGFGGSPGERARRVAESYFTVPGPPLVLLVDDLEYADGESRVLAEALIRECDRRASGRAARGLAVVVSSAGAPVPVAKKWVRALKPRWATFHRADCSRVFSAG